MIVRLFLVWIAGICLPATLGAQDKKADGGNAKSEIDSYIQAHVDASVVNAISVGIVKGDQRWTAHYGKLSKKIDLAPNDQTVYEIGSISKVFTGILLSDAVVSGSLKLDQSIGSVESSIAKNNPIVADSIQLVHLATHNSGLPRMPTNWKPADEQQPYVDYDRKLLLEFAATIRPTRKPNTQTSYSNVGVGLLGELMAIHAKEPYEKLLQRVVVSPLGMKDTSVKISSDQRARLAPPHNVDLEPDTTWEFGALAGAGGIRSTAKDMIRFVAAAIDPPNGPLGEAIDFSWKRQVPERRGQFAMGLGWHIARDGSTRWHNGQTGGYHSALFVNRKLKTGVVVLGNTATSRIDTIAESVFQILIGMHVEPPVFEREVEVSSDEMQRLVGKYQLAPQFVLQVTLNDGKLMAQATGQGAARIYPMSKTKWMYRIVDAQLEFTLPKKGAATSLVLLQNGQRIPGNRVAE